MGTGHRERFVDNLVIVRVAVIHITAAFIHIHFVRDTLLLTTEELVQPGLREVLACVYAGRHCSPIVVIRIPEQAGIHITVIHNIGKVTGREERQVLVVTEIELSSLVGSALRSYEHNAESCPGAIDGGRCRIFQHRHALYIVRIQEGGISLHAVDEDKCVSSAAHRGGTADIELRAAAGLTVGKSDVQVRNGTNQHLRGIGRRSSRENFRRHLVNCAGKVGPFHAAITHHHHFRQEFGRRVKTDGYRPRAAYREAVVFVSQGRNHDLLPILGGNREFAVNRCYHAIAGFLHHDSGADYRFPGSGVLDNARDGDRLRKSGHGKEKQQD